MQPERINRERLATSLMILSEACQRQISKQLLTAYLDSLNPHYNESRIYVESCLKKAKGPSSFPSIAEILDAIGKGEADETQLSLDQAREAASRIVDSVSKFGHSNFEGAKTYIGELGWAVVTRQGGWASICEMLTYDNMGMLQAQWRELAQVLQRKALAGTLDEPPGLPEPSPALKRALAIAQGET